MGKLNQDAMDVLSLYASLVKDVDQTQARAYKIVDSLLKHNTKEMLTLAVKNYANSGTMPKDKQYRVGVATFFDVVHDQWKFWAYQPPIKPDNGGCEYDQSFDTLDG